MLIRSAHEDDAAAIAEIYAPHVEGGTASFELEAPDAREIRRRMDSVQDAGLPYLVAEIEGKVAGYAYASTFRPRPAYRFTVEDSVYVHHDFHGRGVGRMLLTQLIEMCGERNLHEMIAAIANPQENRASIALHEAVGFREVGTLKGVGYKQGESLDILLMQKHLAHADAWPRP